VQQNGKILRVSDKKNSQGVGGVYDRKRPLKILGEGGKKNHLTTPSKERL